MVKARMNKQGVHVCDVKSIHLKSLYSSKIYTFGFILGTHHHGGTGRIWLGSCGAGRNGSLNLHDNIVATIGEGNRSKGVEDSRAPSSE